MIDIEEYLEIIKKLEPLNNSKFKYNGLRWRYLNGNLKNSVIRYLDKEISRQNIIDSFKEYFKGKIDVETPFTLTMIWGFSETGYGTFRTNKYLSHEGNKQLVVKALQYIRNNDLENGYKTFKQVKGLGISYISKLMYFATRALPNCEEYCLIYDIRVARTLLKISCPKEIYEILQVSPSDKYEHYMSYNEMLHRISKNNNIDADALEMFLFDYDELIKK